jgi:hypothetical protein
MTTDAGEVVGGWPEPSADVLRQLDDDPLRAADVAEPIAVFVALEFADELRAAGSQPREDGVDVVDDECEMADARGVRRRWPTWPRLRLRHCSPEEVHGKRIVVVSACYAGSAEGEAKALRPLKKFRAPLVALIGPMPYRLCP